MSRVRAKDQAPIAQALTLGHLQVPLGLLDLVTQRQPQIEPEHDPARVRTQPGTVSRPEFQRLVQGPLPPVNRVSAQELPGPLLAGQAGGGGVIAGPPDRK